MKRKQSEVILISVRCFQTCTVNPRSFFEKKNQDLETRFNSRDFENNENK